MTRHPCRFARTIVFAIFLSPFGILLSLPGTAFAQGGEQGLSREPGLFSGEADVLARAAAEEAAESIAPDRLRGEPVSPERLERWRSMSPEERERIRERYRRWKELPPEERERIKERHRRWRELPEEQRRYLKDRRELMKDAGPEDRVVVRKFFDRMHSLPPGVAQCGKAKDLGVAISPAGGARGGDALLALLPRSFRAGTRNPPVVPVRARRGAARTWRAGPS